MKASAFSGYIIRKTIYGITRKREDKIHPHSLYFKEKRERELENALDLFGIN
jgi:hypothetical protein